MRKFTIQKKSGGLRTIYAPSIREKLLLRDVLKNELQRDFSECVQAFVNDRNIVTNAKLHTGYAVSICFDLSNFFDTVTPKMLKGKVNKTVLENCFVDGIAGQGLPTSPAVANIAAQTIDDAILKMLKKLDPSSAYTRYADDLTISSDNVSDDHIQMIIRKVKEIVTRCGFKLNEKKTKVQKASNGRREICGLMVDNEVHMSRYHRRKMRAAAHNAQGKSSVWYSQRKLEYFKRSYEGLSEFSKLREPGKNTRRQRFEKQLEEALVIATNYSKIDKPSYCEKKIQEKELGTNAYITNDPVYFLGISSYGSTWKSCMALATGSFSKGVTFWQQHPGVSVGIYVSDKDKSLCGIVRKALKARALIYSIKGNLYYGRVYGEDETVMNHFKGVLHANGIKSINCMKNNPIDGYIAKNLKTPYFDNVTTKEVTIYNKSTAERYKRRKLYVK